MTTYISLLRGINVGGYRKILMADLKSLYRKLGFSKVTSYIQSGNVVFEAEEQENPATLAPIIQHAIQKQYGFEVPVIIRTLEEMSQIISSNPFLKEQGIELKKLSVTFLEKSPSPENIKKIENLQKLKPNNTSSDKFKIIGDNIFLLYQEQVHKTKLTNSFFERHLNMAVTSRNWNTVNKLYEIAVIL